MSKATETSTPRPDSTTHKTATLVYLTAKEKETFRRAAYRVPGRSLSKFMTEAGQFLIRYERKFPPDRGVKEPVDASPRAIGDLWTQGWRQSEIARRVNLSRERVRQIIRELGYKEPAYHHNTRFGRQKTDGICVYPSPADKQSFLRAAARFKGRTLSDFMVQAGYLLLQYEVEALADAERRREEWLSQEHTVLGPAAGPFSLKFTKGSLKSETE